MEGRHIPVLISEVLASLDPKPGESYLDMTAGFGGHSMGVLDRTQNGKDTVLVDRDEMAIKHLKKMLPGIQTRHEDFYQAALWFRDKKQTFDLILMDLGVSSPQIDRSERGFSYMAEGPLDMRMDKRLGRTADDIVNHASYKEIQQILVEYGEFMPKKAEMWALKIVRARPLVHTTDLAKLFGQPKLMAPVFQALRIAVNDELKLLADTLPLLPELLNSGGRVAIISFHSLEDRLVKQYFRQESSRGVNSLFEVSKPLKPSREEIVNNPRARSAILRIARRK